VRFYATKFVSAYASDIHGPVLEVLDSGFTRSLGGSRVTHSHVVDINPTNKNATLIADLSVEGSLPHEKFQCFVLTQTLEFLTDPVTALRNAYSSIRPGGSILITTPTVNRIDPDHLTGSDFWRMTPAGLGRLIDHAVVGADSATVGFGNMLTCVAYLYGLAAEDLTHEELHHRDPYFPVLACARIVKPSQAIVAGSGE
jgi:hypothetical protein